jgi:hypothetical protein
MYLLRVLHKRNLCFILKRWKTCRWWKFFQNIVLNNTDRTLVRFSSLSMLLCAFFLWLWYVFLFRRKICRPFHEMLESCALFGPFRAHYNALCCYPVDVYVIINWEIVSLLHSFIALWYPFLALVQGCDIKIFRRNFISNALVYFQSIHVYFPVGVMNFVLAAGLLDLFLAHLWFPILLRRVIIILSVSLNTVLTRRTSGRIVGNFNGISPVWDTGRLWVRKAL